MALCDRLILTSVTPGEFGKNSCLEWVQGKLGQEVKAENVNRTFSKENENSRVAEDRPGIGGEFLLFFFLSFFFISLR